MSPNVVSGAVQFEAPPFPPAPGDVLSPSGASQFLGCGFKEPRASGVARVDTLVKTKVPALVETGDHHRRGRPRCDREALPAGAAGDPRRLLSAESQSFHVQQALLRVLAGVRARIRAGRSNDRESCHRGGYRTETLTSGWPRRGPVGALSLSPC
jgi:hypothetical protein